MDRLLEKWVIVSLFSLDDVEEGEEEDEEKTDA